MSTAERGTIASTSERESMPSPSLNINPDINPDIMMACAFGAVGILLAACAAIAFPQYIEAWAW